MTIGRMVNSHLDVTKLYEEVMAMEGYNEEFFGDASDYLVQNDTLAKVMANDGERLGNPLIEKMTGTRLTDPDLQEILGTQLTNPTRLGERTTPRDRTLPLSYKQ
ncbi:hypothetical protein CQW23_10145 [Capsicum baccatum]|uniref:Uncharacterized protein n=1 Tax=Capsicum baccatum TaxID=33114 RepID=A0A2G2WYS9_CAPBA|nr:hypothetical protein CQW23_10145 [Capsicum baccatum]